MKPSEIKKMLISSLNADTDTTEISGRMEEEGISFDFKNGFRDKILDKVFSTGITINREIEFMRSMNFAFNRIALTGVAAILLLLISIFMMEGSLSFNSFLGVSDNYNESIVSMLTGN
jgi:hypothetical protein